MEDSPVSAEAADIGDPAGKLHELLVESDVEAGQFSFGEEMIEEVMQELYREMTCSATTLPISQPAITVPSSIPSPSFSSAMSSSSSVFIDDGKNGSCGASVSVSASTVMAGINIFTSDGGLASGKLESPMVEGGNEKLGGFGESMVEEKKMEGCDEAEWDDEWLGRVLSCGQSEMEDRQWF